MTYLRRNGRVQRRRGNPRYYMLLGTNLNQFTLGGLSVRFLNSGRAFSADVLAVRFKGRSANRPVNRDREKVASIRMREKMRSLQMSLREIIATDIKKKPHIVRLNSYSSIRS